VKRFAFCVILSRKYTGRGRLRNCEGSPIPNRLQAQPLASVVLIILSILFCAHTAHISIPHRANIKREGDNNDSADADINPSKNKCKVQIFSQALKKVAEAMCLGYPGFQM